ncbi:MAG: aminotransferase class III-fold pyridoxal phosphate-dependent enzyme, partial [Acidiferrobacterales bacterium]|nr:aminotransferase class III-fold pyridoxal phosphate-dependent enzyme [Acidiferrobacterales bacterium]
MLDRTLISTAESDHLALGATDEANLAGRIFVRGEGTRLYDHLDQVVLDFAAGILTQNVGHSHPYVTDRVIRQIKELVNVHDSSTPARDELCAKLSNV